MLLIWCISSSALNDLDRSEDSAGDRAIMFLLDDTTVRSAELFADPKHEKRNGLWWGDVDFSKRMIEVYGKFREYE